MNCLRHMMVIGENPMPDQSGVRLNTQQSLPNWSTIYKFAPRQNETLSTLGKYFVCLFVYVTVRPQTISDSLLALVQ